MATLKEQDIVFTAVLDKIDFVEREIERYKEYV